MSLACIFPGQGSQVVGMGVDLVESYEVARELFARADDALGYSLSEICFNGPVEKLSNTAVAQPAILVTSVAVLRVLEEQGKLSHRACEATCGLSLGEYSALVFARSLSFDDAVRLVGRRGELMSEAGARRAGGMLSILGLEREAVEGIVEDAAGEGDLVIANINCPGQFVVSGDAAAIDRAESLAVEREAYRAVKLQVSGAFHSPLMAPAQQELAKTLDDVSLAAPEIPFLSNVTGDYENDAGRIRELLVLQLGSSVLWRKSMERLLADGVTRFHEIGPGTVLRGLLKRIDRNGLCVSVGTVETVEKLDVAG